MRSGLFIFAALGMAAQAAPDQGAVLRRFAEEAERFAAEAPGYVGREKLRQTSRGSPVRVHEVESEFALVSVAPGDVREVRKVVSVNGKRVRSSRSGLDSLADGIASSHPDQKRKLLERFERHGLHGAATDFAPLLLLFAADRLERFEFAFARADRMNDQPAWVYRYQQLDGDEALIIFEKGKPIRQRLRGEIWVIAADLQPARITLDSETAGKGHSLRDFSFIDYARSGQGVLLPARVVHKQFRDSVQMVEDDFHYTEFRPSR